MIQPDARSRFTMNDLSLVLEGASGVRPATDDVAIRLLDVDLDDLLDQPKVAEKVRTAGPPGPSTSLFFYVLIRQALVHHDIPDRRMADYCASLLRDFGQGDRAHRVAPMDDHKHTYLVDIMSDAAASDGDRRFRVLVHLGNYALWLSGVFPEHIDSKQSRRGGPGLSYYDALGGLGYSEASGHPLADQVGMTDVYRTAGDRFSALRSALNDVSKTLNLRPA